MFLCSIKVYLHRDSIEVYPNLEKSLLILQRHCDHVVSISMTFAVDLMTNRKCEFWAVSNGWEHKKMWGEHPLLGPNSLWWFASTIPVAITNTNCKKYKKTILSFWKAKLCNFFTFLHIPQLRDSIENEKFECIDS